jgi:hypothetical protein
MLFDRLLLTAEERATFLFRVESTPNALWNVDDTKPGIVVFGIIFCHLGLLIDPLLQMTLREMWFGVHGAIPVTSA